jgi:hypothetical protein
VVHHALMNILEPLIDKQFIYDSYACRKNKGVHKAVDRYQQFAKRYNKGKLEFKEMHPFVMSWLGHASHGETIGLQNKIFKEVVFRRY